MEVSESLWWSEHDHLPRPGLSIAGWAAGPGHVRATKSKGPTGNLTKAVDTIAMVGNPYWISVRTMGKYLKREYIYIYIKYIYTFYLTEFS